MASSIAVADSVDRIAHRDADASSSFQARRLLSLDVFRGLTILAMIVVNNPGTSERDQYWPLQHAEWHNPTPTDLIFPTFLFIVGTSLAYSLRKYREHKSGTGVESTVYWRIATRTVVLILLGLFMGIFAKVLNYLFGNSSTIALETLRFPGILQRIALVYCATALIALHVPVRGQFVLAATVLLGYWALLTWLPNPNDTAANLSPAGNLARVVDRLVLTDNHLWTQSTSEPTDPENLLGTIPAVVNAILGYWSGLFIWRRGVDWKTALWLMAAGACCIAAAFAWSPLLPINKRIWTSSFVLLAGGVSMQGLALCLLVFDVLNWRRYAWIFVIAGVNAIFVWVATGLLDRFLLRLPAGHISARQWLYNHAFHSWIADAYLASLGYALAMLVFWWLILWAMSRRGWEISV